MNNKITTVAKAVTLILATASSAAHADLVITEYVEGSGNNKAIEISNLGTSTIDLTANEYVLTLYTNGTTEPGNNVTLSGNLAAGGSIVFHNAGADDEFKIGTDSTVTYFNGDDALVLTKNGAVIDRFGRVGERPDGGWTDPNDSDFNTKDKTLRRKASVTTGDTDATAAFPGDDNQWVTFDINTADGLGCPGVDACNSTAEPGLLLITEYIEGTGNNKAVEISNVGGSEIDLDTAVYKLSLYANGDTAPGNTEILSGTLAAGKSIVFHNAGADDEFKIGTDSTVTYFNGDDALVLSKDDVVIDRIGQVGDRPSSGGWTDPNDPDFNTKDKTLRRKATVKAGDTDATAPFPGDNNQWLTFDVNTADGLGCAGEGACDELPGDPDNTPEEPETPTGPCNNCEELTAVADPSTFNPNIYYSDILNGDFADSDAMKAAISQVIAKDHQQLTYKQVWTAITYSDEDPTNSSNVIELYTGTSISKHKNGGNQGDWNREHVWAKSHGFPGTSQLGYTDVHHLRAEDVKVNSIRSNFDFDNCREATCVEVAEAPGSFVDTTTYRYEPRDEIKGDVARMMFYMDTRYQGDDVNGSTSMPNLTLIDRITTREELANNDPLHGKLCSLYAWHQNDPVDAADQQRNDAVYKYQGNRNPYIDNPEWVQAVYGEQCGDPVTPGLDVDMIVTAPEAVNEAEGFTLDASETVLEGVELSFNWEQTAGPALEFDATNPVLELTAPEVDADTALTFILTVSDGTLDARKTVNVIVENVPLALDISFTGNTELNEGESTVITALVTDVVSDVQAELTYTWQQISGQQAEYSADGLVLNLTAPEVALDQTLVFELVASNGAEQVSAPVSIKVKNTQDASSGWTQPKGAGSLGAGLLLLLPLLWRRRQR